MRVIRIILLWALLAGVPIPARCADAESNAPVAAGTNEPNKIAKDDARDTRGFAEVYRDAILVLSVPGLYCILLLAGRRLKRRHGVKLGFLYQLFAISLAILASNVTSSFMGLLGRHSYAIYLAHFAWIMAVTALSSLDLVPLFVLVTGLSLATSYFVTEPLIERHFNRLGHLLASRVRRPRAPAIAA